MTKQFFISIMFVSLLSCFEVQAQTYPAKDGGDNKIYYRIVSTCEQYAGKCIQDNTSNTHYTYLISNYDSTNTKQEFELIYKGDNSEQYIIRNHSSRKYFWNLFIADGIYNHIKPTSDRSDAVVINIIPLKKDQVLLEFTGYDGLTFYLSAADENTVDENVYLEDAQDSRYAWYIINSKVNLNTGLESVKKDFGVQVYARNGYIIVKGCDQYTIHDLSGRILPADNRLASGIYIVRTPNQHFKVAVR